MDIKEYKFKIGDDVITTDGKRGKIFDICTCSQCLERGFCEPIWITEDDNDRNYITIETAIRGFREYYQIGEYRFNDFDKSEILGTMALYEKELKQLKKQLKVIEDLESMQ